MRLTPITLRDARGFIDLHHRHNIPPRGWRFGVGLTDNDQLIGVAVASRPIARALDDGTTIEIIRVATDGTKNANSKLYAAICRAAKALGYTRAITYTLDTESGSSLRATGFAEAGRTAGTRQWHRTAKPSMNHPTLFGSKYPQHAGHKIRWERHL